MRLLGLELEQPGGSVYQEEEGWERKSITRGDERLGEEWNRGSCFNYVRFEKLITLLKLFTKFSQ